MGNDANGIVACVKLKFFHLEGGGLNHQRLYQRARWRNPSKARGHGAGAGLLQNHTGKITMLSDVINYFGLAREFDQAGYYETAHHQFLLKEIAATIKKGR